MVKPFMGQLSTKLLTGEGKREWGVCLLKLKAIFENDCTHNVVRYALLTHPTIGIFFLGNHLKQKYW